MSLSLLYSNEEVRSARENQVDVKINVNSESIFKIVLAMLLCLPVDCIKSNFYIQPFNHVIPK